MKLTYFDFNGGRGEDCRLALHIAGVEFEDDRIHGPMWRDLKPNTPWGNLPVLTTEHGQLGQSNAILQYIGRAYGLHPTDPWEAARHESVMEAMEEARNRIAQDTDDSSPEAKMASREKFRDGYLSALARSLEANITGPFLSGDAINVADLKVATFMLAYKSGGIDHIPAEFFEAYPKLEALYAAVNDHEGVRSWHHSHKVAL